MDTDVQNRKYSNRAAVAGWQLDRSIVGAAMILATAKRSVRHIQEGSYGPARWQAETAYMERKTAPMPSPPMSVDLRGKGS